MNSRMEVQKGYWSVLSLLIRDLFLEYVLPKNQNVNNWANSQQQAINATFKTKQPNIEAQTESAETLYYQASDLITFL